MRPDILNPLFAEISVLKGIGPALARPLERLGLARAVDIAFHLPVSWVDRHLTDELDLADAGRVIGIELTPVDYKASGGARTPFRVQATDRYGNYVSLVYFGKNSGWPRKLLPLNEAKFVSGKLESYGETLQIVHPDVLPPDEASALPARESVYGLSDGLTNNRMRDLVAQVLARAPDLPEWIEPSLLARKGWPGWREALARIHADPSDAQARERLAYDEILAGQLALMLVRQSSRRRRGVPIAGDGRLRAMLKLPFAPTGAQRRAFGEIEGDMAQATPMLRLLQGDVGSGKTLVALMALLNAVEAGMQGAMLAPTEILARQHYETLRKMASGLPVEIAILTGRDKGKVREATLMGLADGSIDILVGTHAIFQEKVQYKALGLAVIDEQHRFGVAQRMMLANKAAQAPHLLVMTATPIPRTLGMTLFGDLDVSTIDGLPPGRTAVRTSVVAPARRPEVYERLKARLDEGDQAFIVVPAIEENSEDGPTNLRALMRKLEDGPLRGSRVAALHGRLKRDTREHVMGRFRAGLIDCLIATTVIEVGVDVPNATIMIIEDADRFGLAQLHQLRGRVGRGEKPSACVLIGEPKTDDGRKRLEAMAETTSGFVLAERDFEIRGPGELFGTKQSGLPPFRVADLMRDLELLEMARRDAAVWIERSPRLNSSSERTLRRRLMKRYGDSLGIGDVG